MLEKEQLGYFMIFKRYNLDELDFLRETKATLKFGIVHKDWKELNHQYYGPIDDPHLLASKKTLKILNI